MIEVATRKGGSRYCAEGYVRKEHYLFVRYPTPIVNEWGDRFLRPLTKFLHELMNDSNFLENCRNAYVYISLHYACRSFLNYFLLGVFRPKNHRCPNNLKLGISSTGNTL